MGTATIENILARMVAPLRAKRLWLIAISLAFENNFSGDPNPIFPEQEDHATSVL